MGTTVWLDTDSDSVDASERNNGTDSSTKGSSGMNVEAFPCRTGRRSVVAWLDS